MWHSPAFYLLNYDLIYRSRSWHQICFFPYFVAKSFLIFELSLNRFIGWIRRSKRIQIDDKNLLNYVTLLNRLFLNKWVSLIAVVISCITLVGWIVPEFTNQEWSWPTIVKGGGIEKPTIAGMIMIITYIFSNFLLYSTIFRIIIWIYFVHKLSRYS